MHDGAAPAERCRLTSSYSKSARHDPATSSRIATLNFEKTLNSLSLPMIEILAPALARWNARDDVVAVLLRGAGERAFCAGGDIQALYHGMSRNHAANEQVDDYAARFFEAEYRLDYAIHRSQEAGRSVSATAWSWAVASDSSRHRSIVW